MLKRLLLGFLASAYLALIGIQASHFHKDASGPKSDSCAVCASIDQTARQAPNAAPTVVSAPEFTISVQSFIQSAANAELRSAQARAPPAAA